MVNQAEIPWCLLCDETHSELACPKNFGTREDEGPSYFESLNLVEGDFNCNLQQKSHTDEQMRQIKERTIDTAKIARINMLNSMDENAKNEL
jgi:hypothetical protein